MVAPLPKSLPPAVLQARVLPIVLRRLSSTPLSDHTTIIDLLSSTTRLLASDRQHHGHLSQTTVLPLQLALHLSGSETSAPALPLPLLLDLTSAYPAHRNAIFNIWDHAFDKSLVAATARTDAQSPGESGGSEDEADSELVLLIQSELVPALVSRIQHKPSVADISTVSALLLVMVRAHEELLAILLSEADYILPTLRGAYTSLEQAPSADGSEAPLSREAVRAKESILLFCAELVGAVQGETVREGLKRLAGVPVKLKEGGEGFLRNNSMGEDLGIYLAAIDAKEKGQAKQSEIVPELTQMLEENMDDEARGDPRVQAILQLFPSLPPAQLLLALNHPSYATSSTSTPEEQASPLLEVILSGGSDLPSDLVQLRHAIQSVSDQQGSISTSASVPAPPPHASSAPPAAPAKPQPYVRSNIHDDAPLDFSRLTLRDGTDVPTPLALAPGLGKEVSDEMRASIMRLVDRQRIEAEEQARALANATGQKYRPERYDEAGGLIPINESMEDDDDHGEEEDGGKSGLILKEGDESGEEEVGENVVETSKKNQNKPQNTGYDVTIQTKLELAYLADVRVFDKDGETRRSSARAKLKKATGMDDNQLEGWRIMLDRNIHKEAILGRHMFVPSQNLDYVMDGRSVAGSTGGGGSRGGRGGRNGGGGGGGSRGGGDNSSVGGDSAGGSSRGGGGRGRGESKGNRGHSNAARTRGHDKKMSRMGQGI